MKKLSSATPNLKISRPDIDIDPKETTFPTDKYSLLSRYINLMCILNATLFVASRLIITHGYWFPIIATSLFLLVQGIMLWPWSNLKSKKLYIWLFALTAGGTYFTVASMVYWYQRGGGV